MRGLGYVEGKEFVIEARFADGRNESLPEFVAQLARLRVDVIVATGGTTAQATQQTAPMIPVVLTVAADPVADGFAASFARPGGNYTGLTSNNVDTVLKSFEMVRAAVPRLSRLAVLFNSPVKSHPGQVKMIEAEARKSGIRILRVDAHTAEDIERGFTNMARQRAEALVILGDTFLIQQARQIAELCLKHRVPSLYPTPDYPEAGGLMSYGPDLTYNFRRAAYYVDRIVKGAKPGELPFEQPTRLQLVLNLKTAKAIGLTIPRELRLRADRVIE
jgi:putative ABC transport system substrate-binding protein